MFVEQTFGIILTINFYLKSVAYYSKSSWQPLLLQQFASPLQNSDVSIVVAPIWICYDFW